jgi:hypothetical protein
MKPWRGPVRAIFLMVLWGTVESALAESPSPTVHWGGLAYPDAYSKLDLGYTGNRFTEFDDAGQRYNDTHETMGINFATVSWTQHWKRVEGWSTNLTFGGGPTAEQPTRYLQNEFTHDKIFGDAPVPTGQVRNEFDFMFDGSITRWFPLFVQPTKLFVGVGGSTGSLYHEAFGRAGIRGAEVGSSALSLLGWGEANNLAADFVRGIRWSAMGRIAQAYAGSAFRHVAQQNYLVQTSLSWGIYDERPLPKLEIETGVSLTSGFFTGFQGQSIDEWLISIVTVRVRNVTVETWNDVISQKDFGPTYGMRLTIDLFPWIAPLFGSS